MAEEDPVPKRTRIGWYGRVSVLSCQYALALGIWIITFWAYYLFVYEICIRTYGFETPGRIALSVVLMIPLHILLVMTAINFVAIYCNRSTDIPQAFSLSDDILYRLRCDLPQEERAATLEDIVKKRNLTLHQRDNHEGLIRFCFFCKCLKPDRCHHCGACDVCVLKMDHHCGFLGVCVGYYSHKFFFLFLCYSASYMMYCFVGSLPFWFIVDLGEGWVNVREDPHLMAAVIQILLAYLVAVILVGCVLFLASMHLNIISRNSTTIEDLSDPVYTWGPSSNAYDMGVYKNWQLVMGMNPALWFLPVKIGGDGTVFPMRELKDMTRTKEPYAEAENMPCIICPWFSNREIYKEPISLSPSSSSSSAPSTTTATRTETVATFTKTEAFLTKKPSGKIKKISAKVSKLFV